MHLDWINPSLEVCRYFLNVINQIVSSPLCLSISRPPESQNKLISLIKYLDELKDLNDNFSVKITLDDYELSHEDTNYSELSFLILDQIQLNKFPDFISMFWSTFTLKRFLNSDEILSSYIKVMQLNSVNFCLLNVRISFLSFRTLLVRLIVGGPGRKKPF